MLNIVPSDRSEVEGDMRICNPLNFLSTFFIPPHLFCSKITPFCLKVHTSKIIIIMYLIHL